MLVDLTPPSDNSLTRFHSVPQPTHISVVDPSLTTDGLFQVRYCANYNQMKTTTINVCILFIIAAHCTVGRAQTAVRVVVGTVLLNSGGISHTSSRIVNHGSYNANTIANDVSVVQTASTIAFTGNVQSIGLGSATVGGGVNAIVTGWGGTAVTGGPLPNQLQQLTTTTLTNADCRARHTANNAQFVFDHKICTFRQAGQGICQGDSGGPLAAGGLVIGIVSWNIPCARGFPDAFDRVSSHRTWILNAIA